MALKLFRNHALAFKGEYGWLYNVGICLYHLGKSIPSSMQYFSCPHHKYTCSYKYTCSLFAGWLRSLLSDEKEEALRHFDGALELRKDDAGLMKRRETVITELFGVVPPNASNYI